MHFDSEAEFNTAVRGVLRGRGLQCIHVREADVPGPLDLVVWLGRALVCWIELKIDDQEVRPSQKEFIRDNGNNCIVMRWLNDRQIIQVWFASMRLTDPPYRMTWQEFANEWSPKLFVWATARKD